MAPFSEALTQLYNQVQEAGSFGSQQQALQIDEDDVQQVQTIQTIFRDYILLGLECWTKTWVLSLSHIF